MKKCYLCLISESEAVLYEGVHKKEGVVNVCRKCYHKDKLPLIEKKNIRWEDVDRRKTVRERLSRISKTRIEPKEEVKKIEENLEDAQLKDLVEKNFKKELSREPIQTDDLVDNFNWVIMRKRRGSKISKEEVAKAVFEPLVAIESLEKGIVPRDYMGLIKKIEAYFGIRLFKEKKFGHRDIISESRVPSGILMSELKKAAEKQIPENVYSNFTPEVFSNIELESKVKDKEMASKGVPSTMEADHQVDLEEVGLKEGKEFPEEMVDANDISLEKIEEFSGTAPEDEIKRKQIEKKSLDELSDSDIDKLIWGK